MNTSKSSVNKENQSGKPNTDELLSITNPFLFPLISSSNDFHSHLALLRSFSFWQLLPFLIPSSSLPNRPSRTSNNNETIKFKNLKKYKCDICSRGFSRSNTLVTHKRIHTGEKPFVCNICDRAFRQPGNLTRHKLIHTSTKSYICKICSKGFNRLSNLQTHERMHS